MQAFFKKHIDQTLVVIALALVAIIAGFFTWSFLDLGGQINRIINFSPTPAQDAGFNLKGAADLDLKGLISTSSPQEVAPL